jgi:hypothetical protein
MGQIEIDGRVFSGTSVEIRGGKVIIDGKEQDGTLQGVVEVRITEGSPVSIRSDASVYCGAVSGDVDARMSVECGNVTGNVKAGMSVECGDIGGDVNAGMGITTTGKRDR